MVLITGFNASLIWGAYTGILIRNSIATANGVVGALLAPPVGLLASLGPFILGHTIHEFVGILIVGFGTALVGHGTYQALIRGKNETHFTFGVKSTAIGIGIIGFAALLETTVSPFTIRWAMGFATVQGSVLPLPFNITSTVGLISVIATTCVAAYGTSWFTEWLLRRIQ